MQRLSTPSGPRTRVLEIFSLGFRYLAGCWHSFRRLLACLSPSAKKGRKSCIMFTAAATAASFSTDYNRDPSTINQSIGRQCRCRWNAAIWAPAQQSWLPHRWWLLYAVAETCGNGSRTTTRPGPEFAADGKLLRSSPAKEKQKPERKVPGRQDPNPALGAMEDGEEAGLHLPFVCARRLLLAKHEFHEYTRQATYLI